MEHATFWDMHPGDFQVVILLAPVCQRQQDHYPQSCNYHQHKTQCEIIHSLTLQWRREKDINGASLTGSQVSLHIPGRLVPGGRQNCMRKCGQ